MHFHLIDRKFLKQDTCRGDDGAPAIKELVFSKNKSKMASHGEFLVSLPFRRYRTAAGWSNYILLSASPMACENMGEWEECVLLKYYIPLRSTPFLFLFFSYFFLYLFFFSNPTVVWLQRAETFLEYPGFLCLIKDLRGAASCCHVFL